VAFQLTNDSSNDNAAPRPGAIKKMAARASGLRNLCARRCRNLLSATGLVIDLTDEKKSWRSGKITNRFSSQQISVYET